MTSLLIQWVRAGILLIGLGYGGLSDLRSREVGDRLWLLMGLGGGILLVASDIGASIWTLLADILVVFFVIEHFSSWEDYFGESGSLPLLLEAALYIIVPATVAYGFLFHPSVVSVDLIIIVISVLIARGLFEARLLYGGADAKALMASSLVLPLMLAPFPIVNPPVSYATSTLLTYTPVGITILIDGALLTLLIPIGMLVVNFRRGFREFPEALYLLEIPTKELPHHFVWLRRPPPEGEEDVETAKEDQELREAEMRRLLDLGVDRVLVTPQLPMVTALAAGAFAALFFGNFLYFVF